MKKFLLFLGGFAFIGLCLFAYYQLKPNFLGAGLNESYIYDEQDSSVVSVSYANGGQAFYTDTAHGLLVGDAVVPFTASAAFGGDPDLGISEGTTYFVVEASSTMTFKISSTSGGSPLVLESTASSGGGEFFYKLPVGNAQPMSGATNYIVSVCGDATASFAMQFLGSIQEQEPNFYAAKSIDNRYDVVDVYDLEDATEVEGDSGISMDESADCRQFDVYGSAYKWITTKFTRFGDGLVDVRIKATD